MSSYQNHALLFRSALVAQQDHSVSSVGRRVPQNFTFIVFPCSDSTDEPFSAAEDRVGFRVEGLWHSLW